MKYTAILLLAVLAIGELHQLENSLNSFSHLFLSQHRLSPVVVSREDRVDKAVVRVALSQAPEWVAEDRVDDKEDDREDRDNREVAADRAAADPWEAWAVVCRVVWVVDPQVVG